MAADPLWINASAGAPAYSANELRQAMALGLMYGGRNLGARQGVRPGGNQLSVSLSVSTITVQPGVACVDPALSTPQGPYWVAIPAAETHTLTAADATNPRKDIVTLRVYDHDEDASGLRLARTEYTAGTPNASPAEPTVPAGAIRLATIDVPASPGAAVVTNNALATVAAGGILPVPSQSVRDALTGKYDGLAVWRQDLDGLNIYDGSGWRYFARPSGATVATSETRTSTSFGDLATPGPAVTVETGTAAEITLYGQIAQDTNGQFSVMGFAVSGASTVAAADSSAIGRSDTGVVIKGGATFLVAGLTAGSNTFTAKYRVTGGTGTFQDRKITVKPC